MAEGGKAIVPVLRWLRDCLAEERSGRGITNVFGRSVKARSFLEGEDHCTGTPTWMADLPPSQARELAERAALYRRECGFHFGTVFLTGSIAGRKLVAPVLLFPVDESSLAGGTFEVRYRDWRFNPAVVELLGLSEGWESEWVPRIEAVLDAGGAVTTAARAIQSALPDIVGNPVGIRSGAPELRAAAEESELRLHAASALLLAERSPNVRGVLDEISRIDSPGPILNALFGGFGNPLSSRRGKCRVESIPAVLSAAQEALVRDAASGNVTVCHGPPGTGKTFTLAAAAIEHAARGEAVLVVCRSSKASDVMEQAIDGLAGDPALTLRTGSKAAVRKLRDHIDLLLARAFAGGDTGDHRQLERTLKVLGDGTRKFESQLAAAMRRGRWFDPDGNPRWWHRLGQKLERQEASSPLLMEVSERLSELQQQRVRDAKAHLTRSHFRRIDALLDTKESRKGLRNYRNALKRRSSGAWERDLAGIDPQLLLAIFPIWIVESDDVHRVLPLQAGLFPLVMIDEGSQCDLASAIPALHRGRRVLIAGDPKQLRHVSFLPRRRIKELALRHGVSASLRGRYDFRGTSLIDAALEATDAVHFLSEHFRSRPELIAFSNATFYRKRLRLMRELPGDAAGTPAALVRQVAGVRNGAGVNHAELEAVATFLAGWWKDGQARGERRTIGFLSPFRAQVDAFEGAMLRLLGRDLLARLVRDHGLIAATAHGFQGDERDVMLLSLAISRACPAAARRFLEREDVFNVSITRARDHSVVFHSMDREELPAGSLVAAWLESLEKGHRLPVDDPACRWVGEVAGRLQALGLECDSGRSVGGIAVDLLVREAGSGKWLALDLVGQRGRAGERVALREQLLLQRAGLRMLPLGIHEWRSNSARCLDAIRKHFREEH